MSQELNSQTASRLCEDLCISTLSNLILGAKAFNLAQPESIPPTSTRLLQLAKSENVGPLKISKTDEPVTEHYGFSRRTNGD